MVNSFFCGTAVCLSLLGHLLVRKTVASLLLRSSADCTSTKRCADSYVDDTAVFSDEWSQHMGDLESFLQAISRAGMTLNLKKCEFANQE